MTETAMARAVPPAGHVTGEHPSRQRGGTVVDRLRTAVDTFADRSAVCASGTTLSYRQLGRRIRTTAAQLRRRGAGHGELVALGAVRSVDLIVAMLATLEIGAAVVPVDLRQARQRGRRTLADLRPAVTLVAPEDLDAAHPGAIPLAEVTTPPAGDAVAAVRPVARPSGGDLAYVAHTSGSQGRPKAVPVPHEALENRITWAQETYPIGPGDTVVHASSMVFDFSFWEILAPLCFGATVAVAPEGAEADPARLAEFMAATRVNVAHFVPSLLAEFLDSAEHAALRDFRYILCGGERLSPRVARRLLEATGAQVFNQYGPAETCIDVLAGELLERELVTGTVPLGRPISGVVARVLDAAGAPTPPGEPGELYVGGKCLAWGYRSMGGRTAAEFGPDPVSSVPGARLYRTGDVVRQRPDGVFEFLGRTDDQVKIHGVRIDPSEVEDALAVHPAITQVAVTATAGPDGVPAVVAHIVCAGDGPEDAELRAVLADQLPIAALPAHYVRHRGLPKLASGKTDRAALARFGRPDNAAPPSRAPELPATETERRVVGIWSDVLKADEVGRSSDFFELGGQSLLAMRMIARVRRHFGLPVPARAIFNAPTVRRFAALLDELAAAG